jgi:hypothetical protein
MSPTSVEARSRNPVGTAMSRAPTLLSPTRLMSWLTPVVADHAVRPIKGIDADGPDNGCLSKPTLELNARGRQSH